MNHNDLEKLASKLKALEKPSCDAFRAPLKERLMRTITAGEDLLPSRLQNVGSLVRASAKELELDVNSRARIKSSVFEKIEDIKESCWRGFARITSVFAPVVMASFVVVYVLMVESVILDKGIVKATVIAEIQGNVYVIRDGKKLPAYENMELQEKDIVSTDDDSTVSIKYLDDSVSRLGTSSSVVVNKLFTHPKKKTFTVVEVEVIQGDVWNKVVNLLDDGGSQFKVKAKDVAAKTNKKAVFNVTNKPDTGEVKVKVLENVVDIEEEEVVPGDKKEKKKVPEGYEAIVETKQKIVGKDDIVVVADKYIADLPEEKEWIAQNLEKDEDYVQEIVENTKQERKKMIGALPDDALYPVKQIKGDAKLLLTTDTVEKEKLKFEIAHRRLKEAQVLLDEGKSEDAEEILVEFQNQAKDFSDFIIGLEKSDPEQALNLEIVLNDAIDESIKELELISEDDPLVRSKIALKETDNLIANAVKDSVVVEEYKGDDGEQKVEEKSNTDEKVDEDSSNEDEANDGTEHQVAEERYFKFGNRTLVLPAVEPVAVEEDEVIAPQVFTPGGLDLVDDYERPVEKNTEEDSGDLEVVPPQVFTPEGLNLVSDDD